jgi:SOS response regulatory protein OraA/RecX
MGRLIAMRIDRDLAKEVVNELFGETDELELLEQTLDKRLRGNSAKLKDPDERRKLLGYLVRQGFSASAASGLIRKRSREK